MKPTIAIAMSGGLDSTVAAWLLKRRGYPVFGIHFITGFETPHPVRSGPGALRRSADEGRPGDMRHLRTLGRIADRLDIRLEVLDLRSEFQRAVVDYFIRAYRSGSTPNPCMICNSTIKFGTLLNAARKLGASRIATGHYAAIVGNAQGRFHLMRGRDPEKEQSYFLAMLTQQQMARILFPLAGLTKPEVRAIALAEGWIDRVKKESQDVCFVKERNYAEFLARHGRIRSSPGPIVDLCGRKIGVHKGLHRFTVGQRRGIDCPAPEPYYVVRIDVPENRLVVGRKTDLLAAECRVDGTNWIGSAPGSPISVHTRLRYRHAAAPSTVYPGDAGTAVVRFERPESAVTPGQCAVFYHGNEVLGGGWIGK